MQMARPSKLNEQLIQDFCEKLRTGLSAQTTCDLLMVTQSSYNLWLRQGEQDLNNDIDSLYASFSLEIKKAKAEFEEIASRRIINGEQGWQGTCWWLERTNQKYMPKQEVVAEEGKVQVIIGGKVKDVKRNDGENK